MKIYEFINKHGVKLVIILSICIIIEIAVIILFKL